MSSGEQPTEPRPAVVEKRRSLAVPLAVALLIVAAIVAYANTLTCPFVFDDEQDIVNNLAIRRLWPIWRVFLADSPEGAFLHSRPVVAFSFALDYAVGGLDTLPYHLTNLAVHILAGLTLFGIVRRTLLLPSLAERYSAAAVPLAFVVAALWTLHPLQTQAVTYLVQRYESLMGLFSLLSLYCVIRSDSSPRAREWTIAAVLACLLAIGCKEVAVAIPAVILLYDRAFLAGSLREAWCRRRGLYLGLLAVWLAFVALLILSGGRSQWAGFGLTIFPLDYAMTQFGVILHYLRLSFWPYPQVFDYGWPIAETWGQVLPGAAVVLGLLAATVYALVRWPKWGTLGAWFFLILAPTSSVMPIADMAFEHRMYLPLAAVAAVLVMAAYSFLVWLGAVLGASPRAAGWAGAVAAAAVLLALGAATYARNQVYQSEWSVWQDVVDKAPENARAHNNLATVLLDQGKTEEAIAECQRALEINPRFINAHCNLAKALLDQGKTAEAVAQCQKALEIAPQTAHAYNHLASALFRQNQPEAAAIQYRRALKLNPRLTDAHNNLGNLLAKQGKFEEALAHYEKTVEINPRSAAGFNNLAGLLVRQGKPEEAIALCQKALKIKPGLAEAHVTQASALLKLGKAEEAIAECRQALEIDPRLADAHSTLANVFARQGKLDEAQQQYAKALELDPQSAETHYNLANSFNRQNKLEEAIRGYRQAIQLDPRRAEAHNNLGVTLEKQGKATEAVACYQEAVRINPRYAEAHGNLAMMLGLQGRFDEAIVHLEKALEIQPGLAAGHCQLAVALMEKQRFDEAVSHLNTALQLNPSYAEAHYHLGKIYRLRGDSQAAVNQWLAAIRVQPNALPLLNVLAWELATSPAPAVRNGAEALKLAERASQLAGTPSPEQLDTLAAAQAESGRFPEATRTAELALERASKAKDAARIRDLSERLKLYRAGRAFHESAPAKAGP